MKWEITEKITMKGVIKFFDHLVITSLHEDNGQRYTFIEKLNQYERGTAKKALCVIENDSIEISILNDEDITENKYNGSIDFNGSFSLKGEHPEQKILRSINLEFLATETGYIFNGDWGIMPPQVSFEAVFDEYD